MVIYHIPLLFNSSLASGAINKSDDGSSFSLAFDEPILIPSKAKYAWLICQSAEIWNTVPNIFTDTNDKLYYNDSFGALVITVPQGLYSIQLLNAEINRQILESGRPNDSIVLTGNNATQKTVITLLENGASIDFTLDDTFRDILGFNSQIITAASANDSFDSDIEANFNTLDYFIIHTDLVNRGLKINNKYTQAVAQVLVEAESGDQILHSPNNPAEIPCVELIGQKKNFINIWLTNQDNERVNTSNENYSFRLVIYYIMDEYVDKNESVLKQSGW